MSEPIVRSVWLEGAAPSSTIKDVFGKTLDQISGQIKEKGLTKIHRVFEETAGKAKGVVKNGLKGLKGLLKGLLSKISSYLPKLPIESIKEIAAQGKKVISAVKAAREIYNDFKNKNFDALLGKLAPFIGDGLVSDIKTGIGIYQAIRSTDWHNWRSIMGLASELTGIDIGEALGITQLQAEVAAIMELAQEAGIPDAIRIIKEHLSGHARASGALISGYGMNAQLGQFDMMYQLKDIVDGQSILFYHPAIIKTILQNYTLPVGYEIKPLSQLQKEMIELLNHIDPYWDREVINGQIRYKLEPWEVASPDAIKLFETHPIYGVPITIAPNYRVVGLRDGLNRTYPYLQL